MATLVHNTALLEKVMQYIGMEFLRHVQNVYGVTTKKLIKSKLTHLTIAPSAILSCQPVNRRDSSPNDASVPA